MAGRVIFHIDVNSAFLSWTAAYRCLVLGEKTDLREIPSVIAGHQNIRTSIVLAKSIPAKKRGVKTGEPLGMARDKCPDLVVAEPDYDLYVSASQKMIALLREVSPVVEQYSIDEAWVDMTGTERLYGPPVLAANWLKDRIRRELGFTVNIGISCNKLLAKMAGDFEKPDKVHTLFPDELEAKLWPLPTQELFMLGAATARKLRRFGIDTIGALANADPVFLTKALAVCQWARRGVFTGAARREQGLRQRRHHVPRRDRPRLRLPGAALALRDGRHAAPPRRTGRQLRHPPAPHQRV